MNQLVSVLEDVAVNLFKWFSDNQMKPHPKQCHLLINKDCRKKKNFENNIIGNSKCKKLLRIMFNSKLNFETHKGHQCKNVSRTTHALTRITSFMSFS